LLFQLLIHSSRQVKSLNPSLLLLYLSTLHKWSGVAMSFALARRLRSQLVS